VEGSLTVLGTTSLGSTSVAGSLLVDGTTVVDRYGIDSLDTTLHIGRSGLADVDILGGTMVISARGNVTVNGDLAVANDLLVSGNVRTNRISPVGKTLTVDLNDPSEGSVAGIYNNEGGFGQLIIKGKAGYTVTAFDDQGNATVSGELNVRELVAGKLNLSSAADGPEAEPESASVGQGIVKSGELEVIITSNSVTQKSMIFITPTSATDRTLFVTEKRIGSFTVGIKTPDATDISFNWWVIN
jgi:hypothetical protein